MDINNEYGTLEVQQVLLEILKRVDKLCLDNDIKYSLLAGSMLGAVRHKGFIPWDDDADIVVDRSQYAKLASLISSDPILSLNKNLWVDRLQLKEPLESGISPTVDIFILDNVPDKKLLRKIKLLLILTLQRMIIQKPEYKKYSFVNKCISWFLNVIGKPFSKNWLLSLYTKVSQISNSKPTSRKAIYCDQYRYIRNEYGANMFSCIQRCAFEDTDLNIIESYDEYLTQMYGDWKVPPVKSERKPQHYGSRQ